MVLLASLCSDPSPIARSIVVPCDGMLPPAAELGSGKMAHTDTLRYDNCLRVDGVALELLQQPDGRGTRLACS